MLQYQKKENKIPVREYTHHFYLLLEFFLNSRYPALSAYSVYLEHIVEMGYIGFSCFVWLVVITLDRGIRQLSRLRQSRDLRGIYLIAAIAATASLGFHGFVDTVWYRPQINTIWWLMLAIVASFYDEVAIDSSSETN